MDEHPSPSPNRRAARTAPNPADVPNDEQTAEELARAAREAVRQPPDPRLERSFAHLGLDAEEPAGGPARASRSEGRASLESEAERIREEITAWRTSAEQIGRQLEIVTWVLIAVAAIFALLTLVILVRGAG